jgi:hypothetical protein
MEHRADGSLVLTLTVCNDYALRAWILGFGPDVRVVSPVVLAETIYETADRTRRVYQAAEGRRPEWKTEDGRWKSSSDSEPRRHPQGRFPMVTMREAG